MTTATDATHIRGMHPYKFRSGEWARIVTTDEAFGRPCWLVAFDDGITDVWVIDDAPAGYEFKREDQS